MTCPPDRQLKSISAVYVPVSPETINATSETDNGIKFRAQATKYGGRGWNVLTGKTLTVSSINGTTLIKKIEFTADPGASSKNNMLSVSEGTLSFDGNDPSTTVTINDINATSVTISGSGTNAGRTWFFTSVKIYTDEEYDEVELEISDTENANVKTFTMVDSEVTISAEFEPAAPASYNVTAHEGATGEYWATYYNSTTSFTADANTTVFQAALSGDQLTLTVVPDREIPADKAVILKSSAATITLTPATTTQTLSGNMLQGTTAAMTGAAGNIYVLYKGSQGIGFYKLKSTGTIGANKAYLVYSDPAPAREFFSFEETTGIEMPTVEDNADADAVVYDLQGRRVVNPTKGLYIVNGKKVVIK